jgi:hypothetical protein
MPRNQRSRSNRSSTSAKAKALVVLHGDARVRYERSVAKWDKKHKALRDSIRASQCLSKEDFDIRINTRD